MAANNSIAWEKPTREWWYAYLGVEEPVELMATVSTKEGRGYLTLIAWPCAKEKPWLRELSEAPESWYGWAVWNENNTAEPVDCGTLGHGNSPTLKIAKAAAEGVALANI